MKLYKFYKNDCPPCYTLARTMLKVNVPDSIEVVELNVKEEANSELAHSFGIDKVPALVFENGNILLGSKPREEVQQFIEVNA